MPEEKYPLDVESVGSDTYIVMSKGHHDFTEFMTEAVTQYHGWFLGGPQHVWIKTTPTKGGWNYNIVKEGTRGARQATHHFLVNIDLRATERAAAMKEAAIFEEE